MIVQNFCNGPGEFLRGRGGLSGQLRSVGGLFKKPLNPDIKTFGLALAPSGNGIMCIAHPADDLAPRAAVQSWIGS